MGFETELKDHIVEIGRRLYEKRLIAAFEGNISARLGDRLYFTPTGRCKGLLNREDIVLADLDGKKREGIWEPSSESGMHLEIYRIRPDVKAVVHAHPPHATAFAVAGIPLDKAVLPEVILALGAVPLVQYVTPTTDELARAVRPLARGHDALLLSNHGALTMGHDLESAYFRMETLEHFAWVSVNARILGRERLLSKEDLARLFAIRPGYSARGQEDLITADPSMEKG